MHHVASEETAVMRVILPSQAQNGVHNVVLIAWTFTQVLAALMHLADQGAQGLEQVLVAGIVERDPVVAMNGVCIQANVHAYEVVAGHADILESVFLR
jgi:hypothetical protein